VGKLCWMKTDTSSHPLVGRRTFSEYLLQVMYRIRCTDKRSLLPEVGVLQHWKLKDFWKDWDNVNFLQTPFRPPWTGHPALQRSSAQSLRSRDVTAGSLRLHDVMRTGARPIPTVCHAVRRINPVASCGARRSVPTI
jgi:hypothetical protein